MPKYRHITLFQNPLSGSASPEAQRRIRERLSSICESFEETLVDSGRVLLEEAKAKAETGPDLMVVAGGDGTVREVASAIVGRKVPLGIVPLGTFNNLALSLRIPHVVDAACDVIEEGSVRTIDVGIADDRHYFFEAAGVGVDAEMFPLGEAVKSGRFEAIWRTIGLALRYSQETVKLRFDRSVADAYARSFRGVSPLSRRRKRFRKAKTAVQLRCSFVAIGNGAYYGSNFTVCPGALLDDGLLSISVFRDFSKQELIRHFWSIARGQRAYNPKLEMFTAQCVEVFSRRSLAVHVDGHPIGTTPVRFRALPRALRVVCGWDGTPTSP
jgi:diacylglycerol kinase (ATP)